MPGTATELLNEEQIQSELPEDCLTSSGYPAVAMPDALIQSVDGNSGPAGAATFTIVTRQKTRNRHGNMLHLLPNDFGQGILTENYARNPVVLYDHGFGFSLPVGVSENEGKLSLKATKTRMTATVYFAAPVTEMHEAIIGLVMQKTLRAASIGFRGLKAQRIQGKPGEAKPGVEDVSNERWSGMDFVESELLEWSITPIGADADSLAQALGRGRVGDVRIPGRLKQHLQMQAAPVPVWSPGWTPRGEAEPAADVAAQLQRVGEMAVERQIRIEAAPADLLEFVQQAGRELCAGSAAATAIVPEVQAQTAAEPLDTNSASGTTAPVTFTAQDLAAAITASSKPAQPDPAAMIAAIGQTLPALVGQAVRDATAPIATQQQWIADEIDRRTGKMPAVTAGNR